MIYEYVVVRGGDCDCPHGFKARDLGVGEVGEDVFESCHSAFYGKRKGSRAEVFSGDLEEIRERGDASSVGIVVEASGIGVKG